MTNNPHRTQKLIFTALFAAIIYIGIWVLRIPLPAIVGRPFIHFGNPLMILAIILLGGGWGFVAGAIGLGGFDVLNGYAATSWLTVSEVAVMAIVVTLLIKALKLRDHPGRIVVVGIVAGATKVVTSYLVGVSEALMVGTSLNVAIGAAFASLLAAVINAVAAAVIVPLLYLALRPVFDRMRARS
ncbi:ECF transporter S component [Lacticaseibacillus jixianensis]|uniref:ECF transporter S component n=1 Tax=Lacticaseibacillus jixianensis TaxID=2486012 RepID=A0ABW4B8D2_9LACO|nr:ECF transporter S component [Lacticaseibacillus jixianensis]